MPPPFDNDDAAAILREVLHLDSTDDDFEEKLVNIQDSIRELLEEEE